MTPPLYTQEERDELERELLGQLNAAYASNRDAYARFKDKGNRLAAALGSSTRCSRRDPEGQYDTIPATRQCSNIAIRAGLCFMHWDGEQ